MAKTIEHLSFYVPVAQYEHEGATFNALHVTVGYNKRRGFYATYQACKKENGLYSFIYDFSQNPLSDASWVDIKSAQRNNTKELNDMEGALEKAKAHIAYLFDQRDWTHLNDLIKRVALYGYTPSIEEYMMSLKNESAVTAQVEAGRKEAAESPMLKQFRSFKQKHPDALMLFRCGDFYETYEEDAEVCAKVLGITLTKSNKTGMRMAGFPHHALDTYLPKLIREGHRIAICDELPKLNNNSSSTPKNNETMKLNINNSKNESANVQNAQVNNPAAAPIVEAKESKPIPAEEYVDFEEVKDEAPAVPTAQSAPSSDLPAVQFSTYTTKRGATAPQIIGFAGEDDPRWKKHQAAKSKYVSASYKRDINGNKVYLLMFGTRYMDVAKALAGAYNTNDPDAWKRAEDAVVAIYEQAQRDGKAAWEAKKAEWKAKSEARKAKKEADKKCYTKEDVAAMLNSILAGGDVPEDIKKLVKVA